jgi:2-polyprenyl-6-methoxyphenol hydroxylase-like FAD-dependent oxidoreductase
MADPSVLIVGAVPTGLVVALWLTKQGVPVRIVDKAAGSGTTSRALAVHARTLELYEQLDLAEPIVTKGYFPACGYGSAVEKPRVWEQLNFGEIAHRGLSTLSQAGRNPSPPGGALGGDGRILGAPSQNVELRFLYT